MVLEYDDVMGNVRWQWANTDYNSPYNAVKFFLYGGGNPLAELQRGQGPQNIRDAYAVGNQTFIDNSTHPDEVFWLMVLSAVYGPSAIFQQTPFPQHMSGWFQQFPAAFATARDNWRVYEGGGELFYAIAAGFALVQAIHDWAGTVPHPILVPQTIQDVRYAFSTMTDQFITQVWANVGQ